MGWLIEHHSTLGDHSQAPLPQRAPMLMLSASARVRATGLSIRAARRPPAVTCAHEQL